MPRVSIITATYNRPDVLRWAIQSARTQSFADFEHIVVGDACTDETAELVASFGDPRLRFMNLPENVGEQSGPNNAGFAASSGELIAFLNHDDLWFPDHLRLLVDFIDASQSDLVYALPLSIDVNGQAFCGNTNAELRYDPSHFVPTSLWLARRKLIAGLNGWRLSRYTDIRNPSQDLLYRAWADGKTLRGNPVFSAVFLGSAREHGSYSRRDDRQHRELFAKLQNKTFREQLATELAVRQSRAPRWSFSARATWDGFTADLLNHVAWRTGQHPDALRNRLRFRRRGWWIDHLREIRGLPPLRDPEK